MADAPVVGRPDADAVLLPVEGRRPAGLQLVQEGLHVTPGRLGRPDFAVLRPPPLEVERPLCEDDRRLLDLHPGQEPVHQFGDGRDRQGLLDGLDPLGHLAEIDAELLRRLGVGDLINPPESDGLAAGLRIPVAARVLELGLSAHGPTRVRT
jgi:hypothetical protein